MKTDVVKPQGVFVNPSRLVVPLFQRPYVRAECLARLGGADVDVDDES